MAFDIKAVGGYGTGSLGNVTLPYDNTGAYSEYGKVRAYPTYSETYNANPYYYLDEDPNDDIYYDLEVGGATLYLKNFIAYNRFLTVGSALLFVQMIHKKELNNEEVTAEELSEYGKYEVRTITAIDGDYFTFDQAPSMDFANYYVQIVPFLDFENLTLNSGGRLRLRTKSEGEAEGILAVRVKNTLTLNGGHINLFAEGYFFGGGRGNLTPQEQNGELDADEQAGQENFITRDRFLLSGGSEGGLFLVAKNIVVTNADSRIGVGFAFDSTDTYNGRLVGVSDYFFIDGVQYCRGAADSPNRPTGLTLKVPSGPFWAEHEYAGIYATNKSGATILIACETFEGFTPALIAKYSMKQDADEFLSRGYGYGKGLARCYIACKNPPASMLHDEGLYALDVVTDGDRLRENRVFGYGNGSSGDATNPSGQINSYAAISGLSAALATLTNVSNGSCPIEVGAMVMIHAMAKSEPPENVNYVTLVGAASLSNPHIQTYVEPSGGDDTVPSGEGILVTNTENDILITGTENADTISNEGYNVTINAGVGDDSIYSDNDSYSEAYVTIDGGAGNDTIVGRFGDSSISGGEGNDVIEITDDIDRATINAGTGNDTLYLDNYDGNNVVQYRAGDGDDVIYYFMDGDTLSIAGGSYTTQQNGEDIIITVGEGHITLVGAANLSEVHIEGEPALQSKAFKFGSKALTATSAITNSEDNVTIYGTADADTITNSGKDVTIIGYEGNDEIHLTGSSKRNVIVVGMDGTNTYYNLGDTDTILVSLSGEEYKQEQIAEYVTIRLQNGRSHSEPCGSGNVVSVTGGTLVEEFTPIIPDGWLGNVNNNVSVRGTSGEDSIVNYGSNVTIIPNGGDDVISLSSDSNRNVIVRRFNDGLGEYYGLDGNDTILISLSGGTYWEQRENNFVRIHYGNVIRSEPCTAGNAVSVTGATQIDHPSESLPSAWIVNRADNVSIFGSDENDTIANYGSNCTIWSGNGDDTISMASGSNNNVVITGFYSGGKSYIGLNNTDTVLVSLNGGEYFSTVETEDNKDYRAIYYASRRLRVPISSGNAVSVTGGIERDYILITNARNGSSIIGGEYPEYIINTGTSVRISCGGGNDTVENRGYACVIDLRSGANVLNNFGSNALIYSSSSMNTINHSGHHSEINFSGSATLSIDGGAKYNKLVAGVGAKLVNQAVIYGFNGTTTLSNLNDYTLTESKPDLKINLSYGGDILLKNVYNNTGVIHIDDAAIAIKPDDYTYNYAAGDGDIAISGFDEASTLNVTGNFAWKRYGNDIIVGVSENETPVIYTGDISAAEYPRDSDFKLAKVLSYSNGRCSLDTTFEATPDDYYLQLISIPQYKNLTLSTSYTGTPKWENGRGGICALAVSGTCNLSGGKLNVESKGHGLNVGNELDGNAFMRNHLPLGNGHGSVFLLAKNIKMNTATRIGATCSGAAISNYSNYGGKRGSRNFGSKQGAHVLIVSDKIEGLNESAISTGGDGAGSGYRGNDGISGAAFICCNNSS